MGQFWDPDDTRSHPTNSAEEQRRVDENNKKFYENKKRLEILAVETIANHPEIIEAVKKVTENNATMYWLHYKENRVVVIPRDINHSNTKKGVEFDPVTGRVLGDIQTTDWYYTNTLTSGQIMTQEEIDVLKEAKARKDIDRTKEWLAKITPTIQKNKEAIKGFTKKGGLRQAEFGITTRGGVLVVKGNYAGLIVNNKIIWQGQKNFFKGDLIDNRDPKYVDSGIMDGGKPEMDFLDNL